MGADSYLVHLYCFFFYQKNILLLFNQNILVFFKLQVIYGI